MRVLTHTHTHARTQTHTLHDGAQLRVGLCTPLCTEDPDVFDIPEDDSYIWKDGYSVLDAAVYEKVSVRLLKNPERLLNEMDRYCIQVPVRGGFTGWRPKRIHITSVFLLEPSKQQDSESPLRSSAE